MTTALLDANVLVALLVPDHVHHGRVLEAVEPGMRPVATCPITQGAFVRLAVREGAGIGDVIVSLRSLTSASWHVFVPDDVSYADIRTVGVVGHRQVTDAYLAALARHHEMHLLTLDEGLAALHADVATLVE